MTEWPFRCSWCGSTLNSLDELNEHDPCDGIDAYHDTHPSTDGRPIGPDGIKLTLVEMKRRGLKTKTVNYVDEYGKKRIRFELEA